MSFDEKTNSIEQKRQNMICKVAKFIDNDEKMITKKQNFKNSAFSLLYHTNKLSKKYRKYAGGVNLKNAVG